MEGVAAVAREVEDEEEADDDEAKAAGAGRVEVDATADDEAPSAPAELLELGATVELVELELERAMFATFPLGSLIPGGTHPVPVKPAGVVGFELAYPPPYNYLTFLPGYGKTTSIFWMVVQLLTAALATNGGGKSVVSDRPEPPLVIVTTAQFSYISRLPWDQPGFGVDSRLTCARGPGGLLKRAESPPFSSQDFPAKFPRLIA